MASKSSNCKIKDDSGVSTKPSVKHKVKGKQKQKQTYENGAKNNVTSESSSATRNGKIEGDSGISTKQCVKPKVKRKQKQTYENVVKKNVTSESSSTTRNGDSGVSTKPSVKPKVKGKQKQKQTCENGVNKNVTSKRSSTTRNGDSGISTKSSAKPKRQRYENRVKDDCSVSIHSAFVRNMISMYQNDFNKNNARGISITRKPTTRNPKIKTVLGFLGQPTFVKSKRHGCWKRVKKPKWINADHLNLTWVRASVDCGVSNTYSKRSKPQSSIRTK
ncbi:Uncharacterised protein g4116 [Pycnogonum litorale]